MWERPFIFKLIYDLFPVRLIFIPRENLSISNFEIVEEQFLKLSKSNFEIVDEQKEGPGFSLPYLHALVFFACVTLKCTLLNPS